MRKFQGDRAGPSAGQDDDDDDAEEDMFDSDEEMLDPDEKAVDVVENNYNDAGDASHPDARVSDLPDAGVPD